MNTRNGNDAKQPAPQKVPKEAIQLYNDFIHGEISRRAFLSGLKRVAGGLAVASLADALMPKYAQGQQVSRNDERIKASYETIPSPKGALGGRLPQRNSSSTLLPSRQSINVRRKIGSTPPWRPADTEGGTYARSANVR